MQISPKVVQYSQDKGDSATALKQTFLRGDSLNNETEQFLTIAYKSADEEHFNLMILKKTSDDNKDSDFEV